MMNYPSMHSKANIWRFLRWAVFLLAGATASLPALPQQAAPAVRTDLEQAIQLAIQHNHALKAAENTIQQSEAEEITGAIRPNPMLTADSLFIPFSAPEGQSYGSAINTITEFDVAFGYTFERGNKRQARIAAAKDSTAVTRSQVKDNERTLSYNVAQQFEGVLLAKADLDFANQDLASFQQTVDISSSQYKAGAISEGDLLTIKL